MSDHAISVWASGMNRGVYEGEYGGSCSCGWATPDINHSRDEAWRLANSHKAEPYGQAPSHGLRFVIPVIESPSKVPAHDWWDVTDALLLIDHTERREWADLAIDRGWRYFGIGQNLGTGGAWNLARAIQLAECRDQDLLTLLSCSVEVPVGLAEISNRIRIRASWKGAQTLGLGWHMITFSTMFLRLMGSFDENFHPGYFGDNDFTYRGIVEGHFLAGPDSFPEVDADTADPPYGKALRSGRLAPFSMRHQAAMYRAKWGGTPGDEIYRTPFDMDVPTSWWSPAYRPLVWADEDDSDKANLRCDEVTMSTRCTSSAGHFGSHTWEG